jgi:hypothetical protein
VSSPPPRPKHGLGKVLPGALRQTQKIVWLMRLLIILMTICTNCDFDLHVVKTYPYVELPFTAFNTRNGFLLCISPTLTLIIDSADMGNPLMRVHAICLIDAENLVAHLLCPHTEFDDGLVFGSPIGAVFMKAETASSVSFSS